MVASAIRKARTKKAPSVASIAIAAPRSCSPGMRITFRTMLSTVIPPLSQTMVVGLRRDTMSEVESVTRPISTTAGARIRSDGAAAASWWPKIVRLTQGARTPNTVAHGTSRSSASLIERAKTAWIDGSPSRSRYVYMGEKAAMSAYVRKKVDSNSRYADPYRPTAATLAISDRMIASILNSRTVKTSWTA